MRKFRYGVALALTAALISPAFAKKGDNDQRLRKIDVCIAAADFHLDDTDGTLTPTTGDGFVATGAIFPGGTIPDGGVASCSDILTAPIGKFFARGRLLETLPAPADRDVAYVDWEFRIDGVGSIDTSGPVRSAATYPQTIVGATRRLASFVDGGKGEATTKVLDAAGFQIRLILQD